MNERIKELADEAVEDISSGPWNISDEFCIKFAKLIVRECLEQIDKIRDGCESDNEDQQALGAAWAGLAVARHFGVE